MIVPSASQVPGWLRAWAWLTVFLCLPLAIAGAEVTTKGVGMVDPKPYRPLLYLFERVEDVTGHPIRILHLLETGQIGLIIELSHRLFGAVVGLMCIVLCVGLFLLAGGWRRWLGLLALLAVSAQGALGYLRVSQISTELAALHGCVAQLVFATLVVVAVLLSNAWAQPGSTGPTRWYGLLLFATTFVQIACGAAMRHLLDPLAQRAHVLLAFVVVAGALWVVKKVRETDRSGATRLAGWLLVGFVLLQPVLGVEAWIRRFGTMELPDAVPSTFWGDFFRSGHHVLGTAILATTAALTALLFRPREQPSALEVLHARAMEGAL